MASDNRHRPGPPFRCPNRNCWSQSVTTYGRGRVVQAGKRGWSRRREVFCECKKCHKLWVSVHPQAIDLYHQEHAA